MADESKTEDKREDSDRKEERHDTELHAKLDRLDGHLQKLHKRMDSYESARKDESEEEEDEDDEPEEKSDRKDKRRKDSKRRADSKRKDGEEEDREDSEGCRADADADEDDSLKEEKEGDKEALKKEREGNKLKENDSKRKDSEKEERHDAQEISALKQQNAELLSRLSAVEAHVKDTATEDRSKFAAVWAQDEKLCQLFGDSAKGTGPDKWWPGESLASYSRRVAGKYKKYSAPWKDVDLEKITDDAAFGVASVQIFNDAQAAAMRGDAAPAGTLQRVEIVDPYSHARRIEWRGDDQGATWHAFANPLKVGKFSTPSKS